MEFTRLEEVRAGWSGDRKYHAWDDGGQEFFLRLSQPEKWEKAQSAFALQEKAFQLGLPVSEPIELAQEEGQVRFVERWLSGRMAEDALPALPQEEQYRLEALPRRGGGGREDAPGAVRPLPRGEVYAHRGHQPQQCEGVPLPAQRHRLRRQLALPRRGHQRGQLGGHHPAGPRVHGFGAGSAELTRGKSAAAIFHSPL